MGIDPFHGAKLEQIMDKAFPERGIHQCETGPDKAMTEKIRIIVSPL
jgi:hypothetical protein